jgi:hypothetical protein
MFERRIGFSQRFAARANERNRRRQRETSPRPADARQRGIASGTGLVFTRNFGCCFVCEIRRYMSSDIGICGGLLRIRRVRAGWKRDAARRHSHHDTGNFGHPISPAWRLRTSPPFPTFPSRRRATCQSRRASRAAARRRARRNGPETPDRRGSHSPPR